MDIFGFLLGENLRDTCEGGLKKRLFKISLIILLSQILFEPNLSCTCLQVYFSHFHQKVINGSSCPSLRTVVGVFMTEVLLTTGITHDSSYLQFTTGIW